MTRPTIDWDALIGAVQRSEPYTSEPVSLGVPMFETVVMPELPIDRGWMERFPHPADMLQLAEDEGEITYLACCYGAPVGWLTLEHAYVIQQTVGTDIAPILEVLRREWDLP